jgi:hypothetical protein
MNAQLPIYHQYRNREVRLYERIFRQIAAPLGIHPLAPKPENPSRYVNPTISPGLAQVLTIYLAKSVGSVVLDRVGTELEVATTPAACTTSGATHSTTSASVDNKPDFCHTKDCTTESEVHDLESLSWYILSSAIAMKHLYISQRNQS